MNRPAIILVDTNEKYLMPLEFKLIEEFEDRADIHVITDMDYLSFFLSSPKKIDILIINEDLYSDEFEKHDICDVLLLSEASSIHNSKAPNVKVAYKYSSVKSIFNEISHNPSIRSISKSMISKEKTQVLMVYSPCGGAGKTTVALGICGALSKCGKRTLYLSTETFQSFHFMFRSKDYCPKGFEKHLQTKKETILEYLGDAIGTELFDYLRPFNQATSSLNIAMEEYKYLIEKIKASEKYDFIVVDTSSDFTNEKAMMMSYCDRVIIPAGQDKASVAKLKCLLRNVDCTGNDKFVFVCNKYHLDHDNHLLRDGLLEKELISEYIECFKTDSPDFNAEFLSGNRHFRKIAYILI